LKTTIYYNAQIIKAVGANEEILSFKKEDTLLIDLNQKTVLPGFIDAHSHISSIAFQMLMVNVEPGQCKSVEELVEVLKQAYQEEQPNKVEWLIGRGYDNSIFEEGKHPTKYDLNKISTSTPIILLHALGHSAVCNSPALKEFGYAGKEFKVPIGGTVERINGDTTGLIKENALYDKDSIPLPTIEKVIKAFKKALKEYASYGITTAQDAKTDRIEYVLLKNLADLEVLNIDVISYVTNEVSKKYLSKFQQPFTDYKKHYRIGGYKIILDGAPHLHTAWLSEPYYIVPDGKVDNFRGFPLKSDEEVYLECKKCIENNWQINAHCNGDAACDQFINAFTKALKQTKCEYELRPVIIHAQTIRDDQLEKMKEIGMIPTFFLDHVYYGGDYHYDTILGAKRAMRMSPLKAAMERNMVFTIHQDAPVIPPNVLFSVHNAVNRITKNGRVLGEEQKIPVEEALKAVTIYAAYQIFEEDTKGSIIPGKIADLVILNQNPLKVEKSKIKEIQILETIKEGKAVYKGKSQTSVCTD
jgi:predicted amidohydrolase YtcJ